MLKFCKDCKWCEIDTSNNHTCTNIVVNKDNGYYLGAGWSPKKCYDERNMKWFAACGSKGKLWEAK